MALTAPALHNLRPINTRFSMGDDFSEDLRESVEKTLVREQSFGNQLYRSITPDWFMENKEFVETFIQDPNDPQLLDEACFSSHPDCCHCLPLTILTSNCMSVFIARHQHHVLFKLCKHR